MGLGKRGVSKQQMFLAAESLFALVVFLALMNYVSSVASNSLFEQNFMARDVALLIDAAYAAPGEVSIAYEASIKENRFAWQFSPNQRLRFAFGDSQVFVFPSSRTELVVKPASYPFAKDDTLQFTTEERVNADILGGYGRFYGQPQNTTFIFIKKTDDVLNVSTSQELVGVRYE